jgi:hypothetical protein
MIKNKCFCGVRKCSKHKYSKTNFYRRWWHTRARCKFKWDKDYKNYGGRGIVFEWELYNDFIKDMHESYLIHAKKYGEKNTTIERIDVNKGYYKDNCRWATRKEQGANMRRSVRLKLGNKTKLRMDWAREYGISDEALAYRLKNGLDLKTALTLKISHGNKYKSL